MELKAQDQQPLKLTTDFYTGHVTAVYHHNSFILAGIGGNIEVFDINRRKLVYSQYVFPYRNIHGIKKEPGSDYFCIWGEKCFRVFKFVTNNGLVRLQMFCDITEVEDWIWDIQWLKEDDNTSSLAIALGHNVVLHLDFVKGMQLHRENCEEKCILYSANFIGDQWSDLVLAAGTVFNQVVIWAVCGQRSDDNKREVIHRLSGHDGVIFSIDYFQHRHLLSSVSDDRSIRIWQLRFPSDITVPSMRDWQRVSSLPLTTLYGHSARVWDIRLLQDCFVSIGEDATCCVWNYQWQITKKLKGHKGKSIWSMATSEDGKFVVTGGGDWSIRLWNLETTQSKTPMSSLIIPENIKGSADDHPRIVALLNFNVVVVITMEGIMYSYFIREKTWQLVFHDEDFRSYSLLAVSPQRTTIALGSITGTLKILTWDSESDQSLMTSYQEKIFQGKIFGLCWLDENHLLITGPDGVMKTMRMHQSGDVLLKLDLLAELFLPHCKQRWASAALISLSESFTVCGDRGGTVHFYSLKQLEQRSARLPTQSFPKIHGKSGVTEVCCHGNNILTAGRDGHYRMWRVNSGNLELLNSNTVMKGMEWIDRLQVTVDDILVYGFHSAFFTVWSVKRNEKIIEVECGGGHRSWDCLIDSSLARFVYLKSKDIVLFEKRLDSSQIILKPAVHGRELCDMKYVTSWHHPSGSPVYLMATCSEDTTINIVSVSYKNNFPEVRVHHTLQGHLSSVRALSLSRSQKNDSEKSHSEKSLLKNKMSAIMFSAGGRAQVQVWCVHFWPRLSPSNNRPDGRSKNHLSETLVSESVESYNKEEISELDVPGRNIDNDGAESLNSMMLKEAFKFDKAAGVLKHSAADAEIDNTSLSVVKKSSDDNDDLVIDQQINKLSIQECDTVSQKDSEAKRHERLSHYHDAIRSQSPSDIHDDKCGVNAMESLSSEPSKNKGCSAKKSSSSSSTSSAAAYDSDDVGECSYEHLANCFLGDQRHGKGYKPWKAMFPKTDPETRILDLTSFPATDISTDNNDNVHFVAAACSDGFVRLFGFSESSRSLSLLQQSDYHGNCVLKVHHFPVPSTDQTAKIILLSAATEGRIALWDITSICNSYIFSLKQQDERKESDDGSEEITSESKTDSVTVSKYPYHSVQISVARTNSDFTAEDFRPVFILKNHQSGVNSVHVRNLKNNQVLVSSGGDDGCLSVCLLKTEIDEENSFSVSQQQTIQKVHAHAAQITGTWVVSDCHIVTASIDQRVCLWRLSSQNRDELNLELVGVKYVHVSDISNMDVWQDGNKLKIGVCGEGLSIMTINKLEDNSS